MNFTRVALDDETLAFWRECRAFLAEVVTEEVHEHERQTGGGFNEKVHLALGRRGWILPDRPVEEGGAGLGPVRSRIVHEELIRSQAPTIMVSTALLALAAVEMYAEDDLRAQVLRGVADGTTRICLGYTEPDCGSDLAGVRTRAVRDADEWVVNGQKMFTTGAQFCQYAFCLTRTNPDAAKHRGLTVFLVPLDLPGIEITPIGTLGGERTNFVHFDDVRVPDRFRIGGVDEGWTVMSAPLAAEHRKNDVGAVGNESFYTTYTRRLLDAVLAAVRAQPETAADVGALERIGRVALDLEVGEALNGPMGRVQSSDALVRSASDLLELLGPQATLGHGADGALSGAEPEYLFRFAPGTTIYGGTTDIFRNMIAEQMLGLPRSTPRK